MNKFEDQSKSINYKRTRDSVLKSYRQTNGRQSTVCTIPSMTELNDKSELSKVQQMLTEKSNVVRSMQDKIIELEKGRELTETENQKLKSEIYDLENK